MSFIKNLLAGGKKDKTPTPQEGIQRLREVEEMLMKKSDFLEKKIEAEIAIARKNGTKNKRGTVCSSKIFWTSIYLFLFFVLCVC